MAWLLSTLITGFSAFVATNVDDIIILVVFFAQINEDFRPKHIIAGQYLGFIALLLVCLPGVVGGLVLPQSWVGLLGLLPIAIGLQQLLAWNQDEPTVQDVSEPVITNRSKLAHILHPQVYHVAAVTFANGGDNIGIYVPLFAGSPLPSVGIIIALFMVLIAVWCGLASYLASHPQITPLLSRYADRMVPWVLIGLGLYILIENGSYRLLPIFSV